MFLSMSKSPPERSDRSPRLRARLADPRLISWSSFAISTMLLAYEIPRIGLATFALSQILVFAPLAIARFAYLRRNFARQHAWVMVTTIVVASFAGVVVAQLALADGGTVVTADGAFTRMLVIPIAGLLSIALIDYRDNIKLLRTRGRELQATRDQGLASLESARADMTDRVRSSLETTLADLAATDDRIDGSQLAQLAHDTIRPLSHEFAHRVPDFDPQSPSDVRVRWAFVLSQVATRPLIVPSLMALGVTIMSIRFTFAQSSQGTTSAATTVGSLTLSITLDSLLASLGFLSLVFVSVWVLSWAAVRLTGPLLPRLSGSGRWLVVGASVLGIGVGLQAVLSLSPFMPGPLSDIEADPWGRFWAFAPVVVIALVLALARTASLARTSLTGELQSTNDQLAWEVARIRLDLWAQQRRFSYAIHGPLQAAVTASAMLLSRAPTDAGARTALLHEAHDRIKSALDRVNDNHEQVVQFDRAVSDIRRTWDQVCAVDLSVTEEARSILDADDTCRHAVVLIIGESVANAAIHGKASRTQVRICADYRGFVSVTVEDDGIGIEVGNTEGLGSTIVSEACNDWHLATSEQGAVLTATLAGTQGTKSRREFAST